MRMDMRTNVAIDGKLLTKAQRATGLKTKTAVVEEGLRLLVRLNQQATIKAWRGKLPWNGDLDVTRLDEPE